MPKPYYDSHGVKLYLGDAFELLARLGAGNKRFDGLVTDPPYASGGTSASDRQRPVSEKYTQQGSKKFAGVNFPGDNRDQRSHLAWMSLWLGRTRGLLNESAYAFVFTDWRQLPLTTDALQCGGLVWRGIVSWDKGRGSRAPHKGFVRHQCEYAVWGTNGKVPKAEHDGPFDGCLRHAVDWRKKNHPTAKPIPLMVDVLKPIVPGGLVLDPFAGGGATLAACVLTGRQAVGFELDEQHAEAAAKLIDQAASGGLAVD